MTHKAGYRVVRGPFYSPAHLGRSRRYDDLTSALDAMGAGIVLSADGTRLVAFHERHLRTLQTLARVRSS